MKFFTTILTFCLVAGIHCQEKTHKEIIRSEFKKFPKSIRADVNFRKAHSFFLKDEHDSTLVYSHNFLASHPVKDKYSNYCHYFRGISFYDKKMYLKAQDEFEKLPKSFPLNYSVLMKLGEAAIELEEYSKALQYFLDVKELPQRDLKQVEKSLLYQDIGL